MRQHLRQLRFFIPLCIFITASAQNGGKAEPRRIEFARGTNSATFQDHIRGDEEAEYVFAARQGQKLDVIVSSPAQKAIFRLVPADGGNSEFNIQGSKWSGAAPATGDYWLTVVAAHPNSKRINYTLRLTIK